MQEPGNKRCNLYFQPSFKAFEISPMAKMVVFYRELSFFPIDFEPVDSVPSEGSSMILPLN